MLELDDPAKERVFPYDVKFKVSIVGHSLVPPVLRVDCPRTVVRSYRAPGGRADRFDENETLRLALEWKHDLTVLWLGGNDVVDTSDPQEIFDNLRAIITNLEVSCGSEVAIVLLEPRHQPHHSPVSADRYRLISRGINRRLQRHFKTYSTIHFNAQPFQRDLSRDGIHWNAQGRAYVREKLRNFIVRKSNAFFLDSGLGGPW